MQQEREANNLVILNCTPFKWQR